MFRLLAGRYLHEASGAFDLLMKMGREPAPPSPPSPGMPDHICMVVDRALAFDREKRYPDARAMLEDVRAIARGDAPPTALRLVRAHASGAPETTAPRPSPPSAPAPRCRFS